METIKLYRGDYAKIKEFNVSKTNKRCYVGPGIYLTNDLAVADSYRLKTGKYSRVHGKHIDKTIIISSVKTENKGVAIEASFSNYFEEIWMVKYRPNMKVTNDSFEKFKKEAYRQYRFDIEENKISFERDVRDYYIDNNRSNGGFKRGAPRYRKEHWINCIVQNPHFEQIGYISVFEFDRRLIDSSTVKLGMIRRLGINDLFNEIVAENSIEWERMSTGDPSACLKNARLARKYFQPYGYIGIEYPGGTSSGGKFHRAFCIWDEDLINQHLVSRIRHQ